MGVVILPFYDGLVHACFRPSIFTLSLQYHIDQFVNLAMETREKYRTPYINY